MVDLTKGDGSDSSGQHARSDHEPGSSRPSAPPAPPRPAVAGARVDPRILAAWHEWLTALASDAEAALAAAQVYAELGPEARDAWLDALAEDAPKLDVP